MLRAIFRNAGIHPRNLSTAIRGWRRYASDRELFRKLAAPTDPMAWGKEQPMLMEHSAAAGSLGAYFLQDQLVARWIFEGQPLRHIDVGSRIDGFVGSVSVFREIEVIDIRPEPGIARNIRFHQLDLMNPLPDEWIASTDSLSCLHTIEHFGLGRYGDPIDPTGHIKGLEQLMQMIQPGGTFYLSTPIGPERVEFNAHRVFSPKTLLDWFHDGWSVERAAVIQDDNTLQESADPGLILDFKGNLGVGIIAARRI